MRCPYCHVHYMDDEKTCPMCGKRAMHTASAKSSAKPKSNQPKSNRQTAGKPKPAKAKPAKPVKSGASSPKQPPRPTPVNLSGSGWDSDSSRQAKKKRGCLFPFLIILVLFAVITMGSNVSVSDITANRSQRIPSVDDLLNSLENRGWFDGSPDDEGSIWYDSPIACMVGTWESRTTGDCITIHEDGSVTLTAGSASADCAADDTFFFLTDSPNALSEDNRDRVADYPPEDYYYCELSVYPKDADGSYLDFPTFDLLIYIPRDLYESETPPEPGTEIAAFHYDEFDSSADSYPDTYLMQ